jgi:sodium/potassium-transporting ATPase subunit alpha
VTKLGENVQEELEKEELEKIYKFRRTVGDASESGLIKFAQPVEPLTELREKFKVHQYDIPAKSKDDKDETVICNIPFSSFLKFNLMIRDMTNNTEAKNDAEKHLLVIMKGAPERIIGRCSKILIKGLEEEEFTESH